MSREFLRVGMLGVGFIAQKYVKLYAEYPRSRLVAVYDPLTEAASEVAKAHRANVAASEEDLLAQDIDAVVISTPNNLHARQTAAALRAGKHVLLQKPMTVTSAQAMDLIRIAAASQRQLGIYMNSLDNPVFRDIKAMIRAGTLGRIGSISAQLANGSSPRWRADSVTAAWRRSKAAVGGGSFAMLACHYINLCQWLLDDPIVSVAARGKNLMSEHIEGDDVMHAITEFRSGVLGVIGAAWCVAGEQFSIHGSAGSLAYIENDQISMKAASPFHGEAITYTEPNMRTFMEGRRAPGMDDWHNPYNQHRQFVDAILKERPVPVSGETGLRDMLVLEAAYRSSESGGTEAIGSSLS